MKKVIAKAVSAGPSPVDLQSIEYDLIYDETAGRHHCGVIRDVKRLPCDSRHRRRGDVRTTDRYKSRHHIESGIFKYAALDCVTVH